MICGQDRRRCCNGIPTIPKPIIPPPCWWPPGKSHAARAGEPLNIHADRGCLLAWESRKSNLRFRPSKGNHTAASKSNREPPVVSGFPGLTFSTSDCLTGHPKSDTISTEEWENARFSLRRYMIFQQGRDSLSTEPKRSNLQSTRKDEECAFVNLDTEDTTWASERNLPTTPIFPSTRLRPSPAVSCPTFSLSTRA